MIEDSITHFMLINEILKEKNECRSRSMVTVMTCYPPAGLNKQVSAMVKPLEPSRGLRLAGRGTKPE